MRYVSAATWTQEGLPLADSDLNRWMLFACMLLVASYAFLCPGDVGWLAFLSLMTQNVKLVNVQFKKTEWKGRERKA